MTVEPKEQLRRLTQGTVDVVSEGELLAKLEKSVKTGKPLRIKAGFDPNRPDLHLGHTVLMNKMRQFQELGHQVIFLIGDFTAMIGDPTGKNETRPALTREEVVENAKTYAKQVFKILDEKKTEIAYNSTWMDKFSSVDFIKLTAQYTVARMLERDDFAKRYKEQQPISVHEFLYPLVQGYDSVALRADVELGGTDQKFNLLVGRSMQKSYGQESQCIMTTPILEGLDGVQKMSKSLNNYIGVEDSPRDMFGKTMRLSDDLMLRYYELLTDMTPDELAQLRQDLKAGKKHPRDVKVSLAKFFVDRFHGKGAGAKAEAEFTEIFVNKGMPDEIPEVKVAAVPEIWICRLMADAQLAPSTSEAKRLIQGGAVELDGNKVTDPQLKLALKAGQSHVLKAGKRKFAKVVVQ
ncbi:MAG TPA: tyrosine--tRNA ligase [Bdellovibrionales bacterium]|nr:tyrosine--tRNA ligase [Bdellovibrionales bacterium]